MKLLIYDTSKNNFNAYIIFKMFYLSNSSFDLNGKIPFFHFNNDEYEWQIIAILNEDIHEYLHSLNIKYDIIVESISGGDILYGANNLWYLEFKNNTDAILFKLTWM